MAKMNITHIQFHIGDFLSGVMHMDNSEIGAYMMLIIAHYQAGQQGLQDDDTFLRKITKTNPKVWKRIRKNVLDKFYLEDGYWRHTRVMGEVQKMKKIRASKNEVSNQDRNPKEAVAKPLLGSQVENKPLKTNKTESPITYNHITYNQSKKKIYKKENNEFEEFWKLCPRKVGKGKAREKYFKALESTTHDQIIKAMQRHAGEMKGRETEFIPHPATWLHQERYFDEPSHAEPEPVSDWPKWKIAVAAHIGEHNVKSWLNGAILDGTMIKVQTKFQLSRIKENFLTDIRKALGDNYDVCSIDSKLVQNASRPPNLPK